MFRPTRLRTRWWTVLPAACLCLASASRLPATTPDESWRATLEELLKYPARLADWEQHCPYRRAPPPAEEPPEVLLAWWGAYSGWSFLGEPKCRPTPRAAARLLEGVRRYPEELDCVLNYLPRSIEARRIVGQILSQHGGRFPAEWRKSVSQWLEDVSQPRDEELVDQALNVSFEDETTTFVAILMDGIAPAEETLRTLLERDPLGGREVLEKHRISDDPVLAAVSLSLLYEDAVRHELPTTEDYHEPLLEISRRPDQPELARYYAIWALATTPWAGRGEWCVELLRDPILDEFRRSGFKIGKLLPPALEQTVYGVNSGDLLRLPLGESD